MCHKTPFWDILLTYVSDVEILTFFGSLDQAGLYSLLVQAIEPGGLLGQCAGFLDSFSQKT